MKNIPEEAAPMNTLTILAAFLSAVLIPGPSSAQESRMHYQPEPDFESFVQETIVPFKAKDAFSGLADCALIDAKAFKPYTLKEAQAALGPCLKAVSAQYGVPVTAKLAVQGLSLEVPATLTLEDSLVRDLNHGLSLRNEKLLGHPAVVRRAEPEKKPLKSAVQGAIDSCMLPMVVRKIETGQDFIRYYGGCVRKAKDLQVKELRQAEGHTLAVTLLSAADKPTIQSLNGSVSVNSENGPVSVTIVAYPETVFLP